MSRLAWVAALAASACAFDPSGDGGGGDTCQARCDGDIAITCPAGPTGAPTMMTCPELCVADPAPRCEAGTFVPSNLDPTQVAMAQTASGGLRLTDDVTLDTTLMQFVQPGSTTPVEFAGVVIAPIDSARMLVAARSVEIMAGATLYGRGTRAVVLVGLDGIDLRGTIDFRPGCAPPNTGDPRCGGPGGGDGGTSSIVAGGCAIGQRGSQGGGGSGGGFATEGGAGGEGVGTPAAVRTVMNCNPGGRLVPLHGGSGGGAGAATGADGGGGGGAIQLTSFQAVAIGGAVINVGGGGGIGASSEGGGGGGAGGAILIEAPTVTIADSLLLAAGGGGGSGRQGSDGETATDDGSPATGGNSPPGGGGGNGSTTAGTGQAGDGDANGGGGGGGGLGHVRVHSANGSFVPAGSVLIRGILTSGTIARQ